MWRIIQLAIALTILPASTASAQAEAAGASAPSAAQLEQARAQFGQGISLAEQGEWEAAVTLFRQVVEVRRAPPVLYNLAHALFEMGEFAEADELLGEALEDESTPDSLRARIEELKAEMASTGAQLTVHVQGETEGVVVLLDHRPLQPGHLGEPLTVRPGGHFVSAERDGTVVAQRRITVALGATEDVRLPIAPAPAVAAAASETPPREGDDAAEAALAAEEPGRRRTVWKPVVGVLAAVVGVGALIGILAATKGRDNDENAFVGNIPPGSWVIR